MIRPNTHQLQILIERHLNPGIIPKCYILITSLRFIGDTDVWIARLSGYDCISHTAHYRVADGIGEQVLSVSPPMLSRSTAVSAWAGYSNDSEASLDWLFEERYV